MKKILSDAAAVGNATGRVLNWLPLEQHPDWAYYENSNWVNMLFEGGAFFETPPPAFEEGMVMRIPGVGSQYLMGFLDENSEPFDGSRTTKVTLSPNIPAAAFWSFALYDNQTRSMLKTPQGYSRAGSQSFPSPAASQNADGSTTVYIGPEQPKGVKRGNWIQTDPKKGWFTILRLYSPLPSFFDKSWQPTEFEVVN